MSATNAAPAPAPTANRAWLGRSFVHPLFDYAIIGGGLSLIVAAWVIWIAPEWRSLGGVGAMPFIVLATNSAHFTSSTVRLYTKPDATREYPFVSFGLPLVALAVLAVCCLYPGDLGPHLNALYLTWSPFHYASQAFGLASMYCFRSGCRLSDSDRRLLRWVCMLPFILVFIGGQGYGMDWPLRALPDAVRSSDALHMLREAARWVLPPLCFAAPVALALKVRRSQSGPMPLIAVLMPITNSVWWVALNIYEAFVWATIFHALQYLAIIVIFHQRDQLTRPGNRHSASYHAVWFYSMSIGLGYALFYCLPRGYALAGFGLTESLLLAFAAINIHHFIVDAYIWRVSRDKRNMRIVERDALGTTETAAAL